MKYGLFLLMSLCIALTSFSQFNGFKENKNGWKPADLNLQNKVLLIEVLRWPKKQQQKIEEYMKKNYPYQYEFFDSYEEPDMNKYSDTSKYQFVLAHSYSARTMHQNDPTRKSINVSMFDYHFIDLQKQINYPKSGVGSSWASWTFIKIMDNLLGKN